MIQRDDRERIANPANEMLERAARAELGRRHLGYFCELFDPNYDQSFPHTKEILLHLEALEQGEIQNLMIFMPPQHGKTYHAAERFTAWFLGHYPRYRVGIASYGADLAETSSVNARDLLLADEWPFDDVTIGRRGEADDWTTNYGGGVRAAGVAGGMAGFGAHLFAIDDPVKGPDQAESMVYREKAWKFYTTVALSRMRRVVHRNGRISPKGLKLIMTTRWNEDDIPGRVLNSGDAKNWTVLRMPSLLEIGVPSGTGRYLPDPEKAGKNVWHQDRQAPPDRQIGSWLWTHGVYPDLSLGQISRRDFNSIHQQNPQPNEGTIFKAEWMNRRYTPGTVAFTDMVGAVDGAWKASVSSSRSCVAIWATDGKNYFLVDVWKAQVEYPTLKENFKALYDRWHPSIMLVEDAASGIPLIQEMRIETGIPIVGQAARGSKEQRAEAVTGWFEAGRVYLPEGAPWLEEWISEHVSFPAGTPFKDQVDTTSLALGRLTLSGQRKWATAKG